MAMLTKLILHRSLGAPVIMTNLYPFLMGQAALKHERIPAFPKVEGDPRDHILVAHCGYLGVVPQSFSTQWMLRKKVLAIVNEDASAIDARLPEGPVTLAKLHSDMNTVSLVEGKLVGYAGYPDSDCLNGGVIRVPNGHRLMTQLASHHYLLVTGHHLAGIESLGTIFGLEPKLI
jgi:L-fucose isomerase-like protein